MKRLIGILMVVGMVVTSTSAMASHGEGVMERYERILEKEYPYVEVDGKHYEMEYELKDLGNFILLEIDVEDNFFRRGEVDLKDAVEEVAERAAMDVREDFEKPVRVVAQYEDENVLSKKY